MTTKQFPLVDVFQFYDGRMFKTGEDCLHGMMALADYMTNDNVYLHNLGTVAKECRPYLADQFPWMVAASQSFAFPQGTQVEITAAGRAYIAQLEAEHGVMLDVAPIPMDDHTVVDPQESLEKLIRDSGRNPEDVMLTIDISEDDDDDDSYGEINRK